MRKFLSFMVAVLAITGIAWYEQRPDAVPASEADYDYVVELEEMYPEETTTTFTEVTEPQVPEVSFDEPDVTMLVNGTAGDDVRIREVMSEPLMLDELQTDIQTAIMDCPGVTDRSMAVQVDVLMELTSDLPAKIDVSYGTSGQVGLFDFTSGPSCDDGYVTHDLSAHGSSRFTYWVVLSNAITPDHPGGDLATRSWSLSGINVTLPGLETYYWKAWGPRLASCDGLGGDIGKIWLAGMPVAEADDSCQAIPTEDLAMGNMQ